MSNEVIFKQVCEQFGVPTPQSEYKFHPTRKWRFDWAWTKQKLALEVDGGVWSGGRHTRGSGFIGDMEKFNEAAKLGWRIIKCTPQDLFKIKTLELIQECLKLNN
jgi:hypothetical protein